MTRRPFPPLPLLVCLWTLPASPRTPPRPIRPMEAPAHISVVDGTAVLERDGRTDTDLPRCRCSPAIGCAPQNGRVEVLFADGSALHLDDHIDGGFPVRRSRPAARRPRAIERVRAGARHRLPHRCAVGVGARSTARANTASRCCAATKWSSPSFAAAPNSSTSRDAATSRPANARSRAAQAAPSPAYVFNSAAWDSFDRWSEARRDQRLAVSTQYLPEDVQRLRAGVRQLRVVALRIDVRLRLVSARAGRLAPVLPRPLGEPASVRLDLDRRRSVGLADASLRPLGHLRRRLVLDSRPYLGTGVGVVGLRTRLRELVSARLEQPPGARLLGQRLRRPPLRPVVRLDGRAAQPLRRRLRERQPLPRRPRRSAAALLLRGQSPRAGR